MVNFLPKSAQIGQIQFPHFRYIFHHFGLMAYKGISSEVDRSLKDIADGESALIFFLRFDSYTLIHTKSHYSRSPVKSIFEGATKYDILHYLEDARDRGLTDVELDLEEEEDEVEEDKKVSKVLQQHRNPHLDMARNLSHRVSTCSSSTGSSGGDHMAMKQHRASVYCPPQVSRVTVNM